MSLVVWFSGNDQMHLIINKEKLFEMKDFFDSELT